MHPNAAENRRRGIERREARGSACSLLYRIVTQPLQPEQCIDEVGEDDVA